MIVTVDAEMSSKAGVTVTCQKQEVRNGKLIITGQPTTNRSGSRKPHGRTS